MRHELRLSVVFLILKIKYYFNQLKLKFDKTIYTYDFFFLKTLLLSINGLYIGERGTRVSGGAGGLQWKYERINILSA